MLNTNELGSELFVPGREKRLEFAPASQQKEKEDDRPLTVIESSE